MRRTAPCVRVLGLAALVTAGTAACGGAGSGGGYDYAASKGAALYAEMCEVCHGEAGEGGLGPSLVDSPRAVDELTAAISQRMPANDPGRCTGECATTLAGFIHDGLSSSALRCDAVPPAPRRLRLLNRREYRATVAALLGDGAPAAACAHTFTFDPGGRTLGSVHVAGAFNGWAGTRAAGGWALSYVAANGRWSGTFELAAGDHAYKLVLDDRDWIPDPQATASVPDGLGGQNSLVTSTCGGDDPTVAFPNEARPAGFPFDTNAEAQAVTANHVDAYLAAGEQLADRAAARAPTLHPCAWQGDRAGCTRGMIETFGRRAFRRPLTTEEVTAYVALAQGGDEEALATALHALFVSPHFLYRSELGVAQRDGTYRLTGYERATALAYGLWGTTPDDALLDAAGRGELDDAAGLEATARRMLDDPRARAQTGELVLQWLGAEAVTTADKRPDLFGDFDGATRDALARETRSFAAHVIFDGSHHFDELLTADYTVLDAAAARFYGLPAPTAADGKVAYGDGRRAGVFGHASVLASHAHSDQTSPIRRGLFVRRNLLCQALPPPPPFAGGVPDVDPGATTRERFAQHTANPVCKGCHQYIDGLGFGFEQLDPVGRWREVENGQPIDASGTLTDVERLGTDTSVTYQTLPELARLVADSAAAPACFTRQYLRFTRGTRVGLADRCARLAIEQRFAASGHDVRELMVASVLSPDFVLRREVTP